MTHTEETRMAKKSVRRQSRSKAEEDVNTPADQPVMRSGMQEQGDLNPQKKKDEPNTGNERNQRAGSEASLDDHGFVNDLVDAPRFDDDGNPIDARGRHRKLDPGEAPKDDVERSSYTVGKGGVTVRGKLYVEGELVELSEEEANQITDMGNNVTNADPVEAKAVAERRAERTAKRAEKKAAEHEEAATAAKEE